MALLHQRHGNRFVAEKLAAVQGTRPLPFLAQIQRAFGRHDVSAIVATVGGDGAKAARELGATAYASGNRISFSHEPDLHLAAHEAAHVVQQREGRAPAGVGAAYGAAEHQADAVANLVVAGMSAERALDGGPPKEGASGASIQRKGPELNTQPAPQWLAEDAHLVPIITEVMTRIGRMHLPNPTPRLRWKDGFAAALAMRIYDDAKANPPYALQFLSSLVLPANLWALVDDARRGPVESVLTSAKHRIAAAFDLPMQISIPRMGQRAVVQWDKKKGAPDVNELVPTCPLDSFLAIFLADPKYVTWTKQAEGAKDDTGGKPFANGAHQVTVEFVGKPAPKGETDKTKRATTDVRMWNWVRVTSADGAAITAEDIAITPIGMRGLILGADQAYRIASSPPYFALPFAFARDVPEMRRNIPDDVEAEMHREQVDGADPIVDIAENDPTAKRGAVGLANSDAADDAALAQAPKKPANQLTPERALSRVHTQLDDIATSLTPFQGNSLLTPAYLFVSRRYTELATDPKGFKQWGSALEAQEASLRPLSGEFHDVIDELRKQFTNDDKAILNNRGAHNLLLAYAKAAAVSHLHAEAPVALADARRAHTMLSIELIDDQVDQARKDTHGIDVAESNQQVRPPGREAAAVMVGNDLDNTENEMLDLRAQAARGEALDATQVDKVAIDASETDLRANLATLATNLSDLGRQAEALGMGDGKTYGGSYTIRGAVDAFLQYIYSADKVDEWGGAWLARLDFAKQEVYGRDLTKMTPAEQRDAINTQRRSEIRRVSDEFSKLSKATNWTKFFKSCQEEISNERMRQLINRIVLQVGIAVATGEVIGVVGAAIRGIAIAGEVGAEIRNASLLYEGASVVAQAAANTGIQGAMGGPMGVREFAENGLAIVLTSAALKPFQGLLHDGAAVEAQIQSVGQVAAKGGKLAAELVIESAAGLGASAVAHAVTHGGEVGAQDAESWVTMGLSIAASKFVGQRTAGMHERITKAYTESANANVRAQLEPLMKDVARLQERSALAEQNAIANKKAPSSEEALELMREQNVLLHRENQIETKNGLKGAAQSTKELGQTTQLLDVPLQLAGLAEVVPGHAYEGTSQQIQDAFRATEQTGIQTRREWVADENAWYVKTNEKTVKIQETNAEQAHAAAEHVEGSNFHGRSNVGGNEKIDLKEVRSNAKSAAELLDPRGKQFKVNGSGIDVLGEHGDVLVHVEFQIASRATDEVAKYSYKQGATDAEVKVSPQARGEDLVRAAAHELAEIRAVAMGGKNRGSKAGDPHEAGRRAELDVLLNDSRSAPGSGDVANELEMLVKSMGYEPRTIEKNSRAKEALGADRVNDIVKARAAHAKIEAEFEARVNAAADKASAQDPNRHSITNAKELATAREKQPVKDKPPVGAKADMWGAYCDYWAKRATELESRFALEKKAARGDTAAKKELAATEPPEPMVTWERYKQLRDPFENGREFEQKREKAMEKDPAFKGDGKYTLRHQVGVANEELVPKLDKKVKDVGPQRPDHLALNTKQLEAVQRGGTGPIEAIAYSDKAYDFTDKNSRAYIERTVDEHLAEATESYGGKIQLRSDQFGSDMNQTYVQVTEVVLVYEAKRVPDNTQKAIKQQVKDFKAPGKMRVRVEFK